MESSRFNLTYCANIHPIDSVETLIKTLDQTTSTVASAFNDQPFQLGLWLPQAALSEALEGSSIKKIKDVLEKHHYDIITFNAFPMNKFHGEPVKTKVYLPDWSSEKRLLYTKQVAELAYKLGAKKTVISSLSGGFKADDNEAKINQYIEHWIQWVHWAKNYEEKTGFKAQLALEPEPFNTMEKLSDILEIWSKLEKAIQTTDLDMTTVNKYLGICLDICHFSVRFNSPLDVYKKLKHKNIPVFKSQLSISPRWCTSMGEENKNAFFDLDEPIYLHQAYAQTPNGEVQEFTDLDEAKKSTIPATEWRTHFHIPIFLSEKENTTGAELMEFLNYIKDESRVPILEVETYSFNELRNMYKVDIGVENSIIKELQWLKKQIQN